VIDAMVEVKVEVEVTEDAVTGGESENSVPHQLRILR